MHNRNNNGGDGSKVCPGCRRVHRRKTLICSTCYQKGFKLGTKHKPEEWPTDGDVTLASRTAWFISPSGMKVRFREKLGERLGWERA